ncbi:hypothetical protein ACWDA3_26070 [Nonomuraea rubra]
MRKRPRPARNLAEITRVYEFTRWSGGKTQVTAREVRFTAGGGIAFWTGGRLELAVRNGDWNNLHEVVSQ